MSGAMEELEHFNEQMQAGHLGPCDSTWLGWLVSIASWLQVPPENVPVLTPEATAEARRVFLGWVLVQKDPK